MYLTAIGGPQTFSCCVCVRNSYFSSCVLGFSRGGFTENAGIGGAMSERHFCEICRRKSPQNTEKHKTKPCAEVPERPLPKDPFFSC